MNILRIVYIKEREEVCGNIKKLILRIKRIFNIIEYSINEGKLIFYLPIFKDTKLSKRKINKLSKKIIIRLIKERINVVVLSKYLMLQKQLKIKLYSENIDILDGKLLYKSLIYDIIEYILNKKSKSMKER